jgi:hypothetical protein
VQKYRGCALLNGMFVQGISKVTSICHGFGTNTVNLMKFSVVAIRDHVDNEIAQQRQHANIDCVSML